MLDEQGTFGELPNRVAGAIRQAVSAFGAGADPRAVGMALRGVRKVLGERFAWASGGAGMGGPAMMPPPWAPPQLPGPRR